MAGVDILRANHGPVVVEVNASPSLESIEHATEEDVAEKIIYYTVKNARKHAEKYAGKLNGKVHVNGKG